MIGRNFLSYKKPLAVSHMIFSYLKLSVAFLLVKQSVHCTEDTTEGCSCDVGAYADTVGHLAKGEALKVGTMNLDKLNVKRIKM